MAGHAKLKATGKSVFHVPLPLNEPSSRETVEEVDRYFASLSGLCGAGTHAADKLTCILKGSPYEEIAGRFHEALQEVEQSAQVQLSTAEADVTALWTELGKLSLEKEKTEEDCNKEKQLFAQCLLCLLQLQIQFIHTASQKLNLLLTSPSLWDEESLLAFIDNHRQTPADLAAGDVPVTDARETGLEAAQASAKPAVSNQLGKSGLKKQLAFLLSWIHGQKAGPFSSNQDHLARTSWYVGLDGEAGPLHPEQQQPQLPPREGGLPPQQHQQQQQQQQQQQHTATVTNSSPEDNKDCKYHGAITQGASRPQEGQSPGLGLAGCPPGVGPAEKAGDGEQSGQIATEEELDVVIDMLSRSNKYAMQAIPENLGSLGGYLPPGPVMSKAVGGVSLTAQSCLNTPHVFTNAASAPFPSAAAAAPRVAASSSASSNTSIHVSPPDMAVYGSPVVQHRQSDGFLAEGLSNDTKTNTWPFRPRQKDPHVWHGLDLASRQMYYDGYQGRGEGQPGMGLMAVGRARGQPYDVMPETLPGANSVWGGNVDLSRPWPMYTATAMDSDGVPRQWSTVADSSSCSDESSNGDMQQMMGWQMVDGALSKRRHSSGGEESGPLSVSTSNTVAKSAENLMETKSTNTWPPKHPWGVPGPPVLGRLPEGGGLGMMVPPPRPLHRPLMAQWSDPLVKRSLSVWEAGPSMQGIQAGQSLGGAGSLLGAKTETKPY